VHTVLAIHHDGRCPSRAGAADHTQQRGDGTIHLRLARRNAAQDLARCG